MRAQFASGIITAQRRVKLVQELLQAQEWAKEQRKAKARKSLLKYAQRIREERTAARKEELKQEMQLIAQLEEQLQAETKEIKVVCRGEGIGAACPLVGTWRAPSRPSPHLTRVSLGTGLPAALGLCCCAAGLPLSCTSPGCVAGPDQHPCPVFTYRRRLSGRGDVGSPSG
ncbi:uncharacterized protein LOC112531365 isoform X6 [Gallus gallus]|uniref:uncharacterized protein LOC112531365 isoform X6 n=1 Tax=Gallus gallus TaxID=9031 RepID=UPI001AEAF359|nr:uncharacterized protein LOC112531365 isoform X6 [Gallus gallus]